MLPSWIPRLFLSVLALAVLTPPAWSGRPPKKFGNKQDVQVTLRFSVAELDPKNPGDSFVECVVHNRTKAALHVPITYAGGFEQQVMVLHASGLRLVHWAAKDKVQFIRLEPDKEHTVFKARLDDVLLLDPAKAKALKPAERRYYWSWDK